MKNIFLLTALLCAAQTAFPIWRGTMLFLTLPPSAQLNGTAGAITSSSLVDPITLMTNPASLGHVARYSRLSGEFNTERTQWLPGFNLSDLKFSARALTIGANAGELFDKQPSRLFVGIGYSEAFLDLGETRMVGPNNEPLGTIRNWERVQGLTLAGSYVRPIQVSFGFTVKHSVSEIGLWEGKAFANDLGVIASYPREWLRSSTIRPFITPTIGYAFSNVGAAVRYRDQDQSDPLPRTATVSLSLAGGLKFSDGRGDWHLLLAEYAVQGQDELITTDNTHGDYHYQWFTGDINVFGDLLLGRANDRIRKQRGWELGAFDIISVRGGSYEDVGEDWRYRTAGTAFRLNGLFRIVEHFAPELKANHVWDLLISHLDVVYNESKWKQDSGRYASPVDNTTFRQLSLYLR